MLSWTHYKRAKKGATQRRQGIFQEHEDILNRILGDTWQTTALQLNKKAWIRTCRSKAQAYLSLHNLPPHPLADTPKQQPTPTTPTPITTATITTTTDTEKHKTTTMTTTTTTTTTKDETKDGPNNTTASKSSSTASNYATPSTAQPH